MQASAQAAPHISLTLSVDMEQPKRLLAEKNAQARPHQRISITAIIAKAAAAALCDHRRLNAHLRGLEIHEYCSVHLGIAIGLDDGLMVPVIRNAETKSASVLQSELNQAAERARARRLQTHEIQGSTFTISNLGMYDVEQFTSILNPPEVAILSVGSIRDLPVVRHRQVVVRPMMQLTLTADHRAVDGLIVARFLKSLTECLEQARFSID